MLEINLDHPITLAVEIPENLHRALVAFLDEREEWDFDQVFRVALSDFLAQQKSLQKTAQLTRCQPSPKVSVPVREVF